MTHDVVLFYCYTHIPNVDDVVEGLKAVCGGTTLLGRVLVAEEGVNGTMCASRASGMLEEFKRVLTSLVPGCKEMPYKKSTAREQCFYDARIERVRELVGWGRLDLKHATSAKVVHLKPREFHEALKARLKGGSGDDGNDGGGLTLLDLRNENESIIGKFKGAITPDARNMAELGRFLDETATKVKEKEVFMYCTGGIRCEKAALYLEKQQPDVKTVYQLEGGIHEYLEEFGDEEECLYLGKNFTFDKRGVSASGKDDAEVWRCQRCKLHEPTLRSCAVCVVCRFPLVLCAECQTSDNTARGEWTCSLHASLDGVYSFYAIPHLETEDLESRVVKMQDMEKSLFSVDPMRTRNKRRTLRKCYERMRAEIQRRAEGGDVDVHRRAYCRNSGRILDACPGDCMGFWGPGHELAEK
jgi:predicted sulfurtransferase